MPDQKLADVLDISEIYTGCLEGDDGMFRAVVLRPREGLFFYKTRFLTAKLAIQFAASCIPIPVPYNTEWQRVNPDHWWK